MLGSLVSRCIGPLYGRYEQRWVLGVGLGYIMSEALVDVTIDLSGVPNVYHCIEQTRLLRRREIQGYLHISSITGVRQSSLRSVGGDLLQLFAEHSAIVDGSNETDQVHQAGESMDTSKALVQGDHLLRVRRRVIALLAIPGFYQGQLSSWGYKDSTASSTWLLAKETDLP